MPREMTPLRRAVWEEAKNKRWPVRTLEERFWSKVTKTPNCWLWNAFVRPIGYGSFQLGVGKRVDAHRIAWQLANGKPIPPGMHVLHSCDVRNCVNPAHLRLGTHQDNMADMVAKGRHRHAKA